MNEKKPPFLRPRLLRTRKKGGEGEKRKNANARFAVSSIRAVLSDGLGRAFEEPGRN